MNCKSLIFIALLACNAALYAQDSQLLFAAPERQNMIALHAGLDYGTVFGAAYARRLPLAIPATAGAEFSSNFGEDLLDDWKTNLNVQAEVLRRGNFGIHVQAGMLVRRYSSDLARMYNLGALGKASFGYYRSKWYLAAAAAYDKPLAMHLYHKALRDDYPGIHDGWFETPGGNLKFGLETGFGIKSYGLHLQVGRTFGQDFQNNPTIPFYCNILLTKAW